MSQPHPLREQMRALESVQELDVKIDQLKKEKGSLPVALKALDDALSKVQAQVALKKASILEAEKNQRQTLAAIDLNKDRLARSSSKLEGVQNSQEYSAAQKELEQLRKLSIQLEEQVKKSGVDMEKANADLAALGESIDKAKAERDAKAGEVAGLNGKFDGDIASLMKERSSHGVKVDPRVLNTYDRVRAQRAGVGVVPAIAGRCKGCNMMLPPQQYIEVQRASALHQCPSCHRILFIPSSQLAAEAAAAAAK